VISPQKVDEEFSFETGEIEKGVKGMIPACCLPLWGREGVPLIPFSKKKSTGSDRISAEHYFLKTIPNPVG
jgi:hypothetical protein